MKPRVITEAFCEDCGRLWSGRNAGVLGKSHADREGHRVRVTRTIVSIYGNGKEK